ncbi:sulfur oxidation c-type cytochrome SoxA [uncultured Tateyamaria sp.]|uniref:sulfur oxidation c-type cytochrome SoxA n=1 Tax=uncultured Tateyamaria sp. TaxID=455651 RepID=UPI001D6CD6CA|nr:sulfur oxidation c-type cytochrome SoxA [uncultured Tateyamaria sp.]MCB4379459.1 sulfur oxidation c-type cytochrome SoxA [Synechococcus sp. MU1644]
MNLKPWIAVAVIGMAGVAIAQDNSTLSIDGETFVTETDAPAHLENVSTIYSGWRFRTPETQALQVDDFDNPAMIFVDQGIDLFNAVDGTEGKSCASCHTDGPEEFAGLHAKMPKVVDGKLVVMEDLINTHRQDVMGAEPWKWSGADMQAMVALIGLQSRGMPMDVAIDGDAAPFWEKGKEIYYTRYGQLELSCSNCHENNYGNMIRADHLSQGQINGFPTYRLKQAKLISRHNRFRGCIRDTRAETFAEGSEEFKALELYVASRANGLDIETPAVRQ